MIRPRNIGSLWMSRNMQYLHGPRFAQPRGQIFIRGLPGWPRYKVMIPVPGAEALIQSAIRPTIPGEAKKLIKLAKWNGQEYEFPGLKISSYMKIDHSTYTFYTIALDKKNLERFINHIKEKNTYRTITTTLKGIKIYKIYKTKR